MNITSIWFNLFIYVSGRRIAMARGNFRTNDRVCLFCGYRGNKNEIVMPYKIGKGANKTYLCERCFNNTSESKEENIDKYKNK